jgi:hypothetical protein
MMRNLKVAATTYWHRTSKIRIVGQPVSSRCIKIRITIKSLQGTKLPRLSLRGTGVTKQSQFGQTPQSQRKIASLALAMTQRKPDIPQIALQDIKMLISTEISRRYNASRQHPDRVNL